jgi:hypothetical protein
MQSIFMLLPDKFRGPLAALYHWCLVERAAHLQPPKTPYFEKRAAGVRAGGGMVHPDKMPAEPADTKGMHRGIASRLYRKWATA